jgi:hypothetical protein
MRTIRLSKGNYGLRSDIVGGGRPSFSIPEVSRKQAEEYIRYVHSKGIKFNYLFIKDERVLPLKIAARGLDTNKRRREQCTKR